MSVRRIFNLLRVQLGLVLSEVELLPALLGRVVHPATTRRMLPTLSATRKCLLAFKAST